ncbi:MAG: hypothetical protein KAX31_06515, partial [Thermoplasmata archaeon]|nr:hypothetical protein [Thermoplasmata archaeon]
MARKDGIKKLKARSDKTKKLLTETKKQGADVTLAESLFKEAEKNIKKKNETEAAQILDNIDLMIKHAKMRRKYEMMIFNTLPTIQKAKGAGADVSSSEELLERAKELLDEGEFGDAHEMIIKVRREAEDAKRHITAKSQILRIVPLIEGGRRKGVDVTIAMKTMQEAWDALKEDNYGVVRGLVKKAKTAIQNAEEYKSYEESIKEMEARVGAVSDVGMDTEKMSKALEEAKLALDNWNYADVRKYVNRARREIEKIILQREAGLTMRTIEQFIKETKKAGIKSKDLEGMLERAAVAIKEGDFSEIQAIELDAKKVVKNLKLFDTLSTSEIGAMDKDREKSIGILIQQEIDDSREIAAAAKDRGIDSAKIEGLIAAAEGALEANRFNDAIEAVKEIRQLIGDDSGEFQEISLRKEIEHLDSQLEEAGEIGIGLTGVEELLTEAKEMADQGKMSEAGEALRNANLTFDKSVHKEIEGKYPRLRIKVNTDGLEVHRQNKAIVEVSNVGHSIAKGVDIEFHGDVEVTGWATIPSLSPGDKERREVAIKPYKPGSVPLDLSVSYQRSFDNTKFQLNDVKDVDVEETGAFIVEDVFLIYNNGLLISKQTRRLKEEVDGDIFSAMLTAISQFAKDSFSLEGKAALNRLEFGDNQVLIERGSSFYIVVTILGEESIYLPFYMTEIVQEIEQGFGKLLEDWAGDIEALAGIDDIVRKLLLIKSSETGTAEMESSFLFPAVRALGEGAQMPDLEKNMLEMMGNFEGELISGDLADAIELFREIKAFVGESLKDLPGTEEDRMNRVLKESVISEAEAIREMLARAAQGSDISDESAKLQESFKAADEGNYEGARNILTAIKTSLKSKEQDLTSQTQSTHLEELQTTVEEASKVGIDITSIKVMIEEAVNMLGKEGGAALGSKIE